MPCALAVVCKLQGTPEARQALPVPAIYLHGRLHTHRDAVQANGQAVKPKLTKEALRPVADRSDNAKHNHATTKLIDVPSWPAPAAFSSWLVPPGQLPPSWP